MIKTESTAAHPVEAAWPPDVAAFCRAHGLEKDVALAVELVAKYFDNAPCQLEMIQDPDGEGEWVILCFDISGTVEAVRDRYHQCKQEWLSRATEQGRFLVCFRRNFI